MLRKTFSEDFKQNKELLFGEEFFKSVGKQAKHANKTDTSFLGKLQHQKLVEALSRELLIHSEIKSWRW